jgi:hypothetical protein
LELLASVKVLFPSSGTLLQKAVNVLVDGMSTVGSNLTTASIVSCSLSILAAKPIDIAFNN